VERREITADLASRLVATQFPDWAGLPVTPVAEQGWDHATFRLGDDLAVRLPAAERYVHQVEKERRWLPELAPRLPLPIPELVAQGAPGSGYPWPWSVRRWLPGLPAAGNRIHDLDRFAADLGAFLADLHRVDRADGPPPSDRKHFRAGPLAASDAQVRAAIAELAGEIHATAATAVWDAAVRAPGPAAPVWIHGDVTPGNLLVADGRLAAVIDFGCAGVGDPAFDLEIAWGLLAGSRATFREHVGLDDDTWARGRGWALRSALLALLEGVESGARWVDAARAVITAVAVDGG
jgi:aminoglycoside phosphotransferase (APT) family kinase protein